MKATTCKTSLIQSDKNYKLNVSKDKLLLYFSLIFAFEPKIFVKYNLVNYIYIFGLIVVFLINIYIYLNTKKKISTMLIALLIFRLTFGIQTIVNRGDIAVWGYLSIVLFSLCMTIEIYARKNFKLLLNCLINFLTVILCINFITIILYPEGIIDGLFFIGIRTRFTEVLLVDFLLTITFDKLYRKKISKRSYFIFLLTIITILKVWIATAIIGFAFFCFIFLIYRKRSFKSRTFLIWIVLLLIINVLIVHLRIMDYFDWLLVDILHKSTTLSGRTGIWDNAIPIIFEKPFFGYGMADNGNFVPWVWGIGKLELWQAHNQWLQTLYDGGIICVISFISLTIICYKQLNNKDLVSKGKYLLFGILAFYLMMIVEIFSYTPYFFLLPFLIYNLKYCERSLI